MTAALIPHPTEFMGLVDVELIDERLATRLACAYDDGAYKAIDRIFARDRGWPLSGADYRAMNVLHREFAPRYAEIRDYLHFDNNVPLVLAARIALRLTRGRV